MVMCALIAETSAQNFQARVANAQVRIRERIIREQGAYNARVTFNNDSRYDSQGFGVLRVRGTGLMFRGQSNFGRSFTYEAVLDSRSGDVRDLNYQFADGPGGPGWNPGSFPSDSGPGRWGAGWGGNRPNGTARYSGSLVSLNSNKCLDISDYGNSLDGTRIQQWSCAGQPNQVFELISLGRNEYAIFNRQTRKVFDIPDNQLHQNGAELQQFQWSGRANQRFRMIQTGGAFRLVNVASGKCLDVDSQSNQDGARIHQWNCGRQRSQLFQLR